MPFCVVKDALLHVKRCPFTLQKGIFHYAKGHVLKTEREIILQKNPIYPF